MGAAAFRQRVCWVSIDLGVRRFAIGRAVHRVDASTEKTFPTLPGRLLSLRPCGSRRQDEGLGVQPLTLGRVPSRGRAAQTAQSQGTPGRRKSVRN
jgi:hypothetical protein